MGDRVDRINGLTGSIAVKAPVKVATTANITLSGAQTIDGVALTADETPRQRVLVKDQTSGVDNGIYDVNSGAWDRSPDFDGARDAVNGTQVLVAEGTTPFGKLYYLSATDPVDIGTDSLTFTLVPQFGFEVVDDLSPQLGAPLDPNGFFIGMDKGGDIASASPIVIDTDGDYFDVTGTTNFAAMTVAANRHFFLQFDGILTMTHHATNLDLYGEANIITAAGDVGEFFSTGANTVQCVNYIRADGSPVIILDEDDMASNSPIFPVSQQSAKAYIDAQIAAKVAESTKGYIDGLVISNDTDADHDISVTAGAGIDSTNVTNIILPAAMVKRIDAAWAVGTGNGGLFTGAVANTTWYHLFAIIKDSDSSVDVGFDTSLTAANIPAGYTKYVYLDSVLTDGSANILAITQYSDRSVIWSDPPLNGDGTAGTASALVTLSAPIGLNCSADMKVYGNKATASWALDITSPDANDELPAVSGANPATLSAFGSLADQRVGGLANAITNTASQVRIRSSEDVTYKLWITGYKVLR